MTAPLVPDAQLRGAGLSSTAQRRAVLALLVGRARPLTAQQVHVELNRSGRHIGLTTVYRALHSLTDAGLLHTFDIDGQRAYRHCGTTPHQHLICTRCETVTECPPEIVTNWLSELHQHTGFTPHPDRLDLRGVCATCTGP
ncbi:Fur family transcriptional regulator [Verrucosispora sp. WMMA2044]|uniref:Transcriptional repressor n=1 Tax=Verrucosispora sioxanthis TaxID=2499994 RepID=A0A6M1LCK1_9ACTN|nr:MULTISPECIES: Fur family transcriptional regulator [Micromonospora]NEE66744.1 transcriptional repressor [Verrucosispora sioxanthis]NGM15854.1 transcriptional repressor [Verrucosispora sioxanthis]WBB48523.1 Fur family transcriptional regulator [Verrucosispora sp. WMMA2044]